MAQVVIYTTKTCPYCVRAKQLLERKGVEYQEINAEDEAVRDAMIQKAGGQRTVPQIFINNHHVGGSDALHELDKAGKLDGMLNAA